MIVNQALTAAATVVDISVFDCSNFFVAAALH
jgi:hypothetical protein